MLSRTFDCKIARHILRVPVPHVHFLRILARQLHTVFCASIIFNSEYVSLHRKRGWKIHNLDAVFEDQCFMFASGKVGPFFSFQVIHWIGSTFHIPVVFDLIFGKKQSY
jgi:hypothetical protein